MANHSFTRLLAVNRILRGAGEQPVSSLTEDGINDTAIAEAILDETTAEYQKDGLTVNTEYVTYTPDADGFIVLPINTLRADGQSDSDQYTVRGYQPKKLYDLENNTYVFTEDVDLVLTQGLDFTELPVDIQFAIVDKAAMLYQMITVGDQGMHATLSQQALQSRITAKIADDAQGDYNLFDNPRTNAYWMRKRTRRQNLNNRGLIT